MKNVFKLLILSMIFLSSCSHTNRFEFHQEKRAVSVVYEEVPADFLPQKLTVISAGDSLTQGVGDSTKKGGYLPYLRTLLEDEKGIKDVDFLNFGVEGNRTTQLLEKLESTEMQEAIPNADLVILTIGGNDIMKVAQENFANLQLSDFEEARELYIDNLYEIMNTINKTNPTASIVLVGLYNPFSQWFTEVEEINHIVNDWNAAGQRVVASYSNAYFVSIEDLFLNPDENLLFTDNFHPNDRGYALIAERLNTTLEKRTLPDIIKNAYMVSKEEN